MVVKPGQPNQPFARTAAEKKNPPICAVGNRLGMHLARHGDAQNDGFQSEMMVLF